MDNFKLFYEKKVNRLHPSKGEWFHGDQSQRTSFRDQKMDRDQAITDSNENGPGIYFTRSFQDALGYAYPNGYVYTVNVFPKNKIILDRDKASSEHIKKLIDWCPPERKEIGLSNWDEDPLKAEKIAIATYSKWGLLNGSIGIYHDFYGNSEANEWANSMMNAGYDGYWHWLAETEHFVVYNPSIISIIKEMDYASAEQGEIK